MHVRVKIITKMKLDLHLTMEIKALFPIWCLRVNQVMSHEDISSSDEGMSVTENAEVINYMNVGTYIAIKDLDSIRVLVDRLEMEIETLLKCADFAANEDAVEEMRKKLVVFMKNIEELEVQAYNCSRDIRRARTVILQRIIKHPNN